MGDSYKDLIAWQRSIQMTVAVYKYTAGFPKEETYGLSSQLRRAAVSVASNIAEGYARSSTGEYKQFLGMARGSNSEVQTQLRGSWDLEVHNCSILPRGYRTKWAD